MAYGYLIKMEENKCLIMFFFDFRLMQIIGLSQKGRILYKEFVELFQDAEETTKYQESSHT